MDPNDNGLEPCYEPGMLGDGQPDSAQGGKTLK